jgi:hypothetical protein
MPINPNAKLPQPDVPSQEELDPVKYRFEGFDLHGGNQGTLSRDIQRDTVIWRPRRVSQPLAFSRRVTSSFSWDLRR